MTALIELTNDETIDKVIKLTKKKIKFLLLHKELVMCVKDRSLIVITENSRVILHFPFILYCMKKDYIEKDNEIILKTNTKFRRTNLTK